MNIPALSRSLRVLALLLSFVGAVSAQTPAFTYQGRLNDNGAPADGSYSLRFILYNAEFGGSQVGPTLTNEPVAVAGGLFTTTLDFGSKAFKGEDRWLEIGVRTNGGGAFTTLSPRRPVTSAPQAIFALNAETAGSVASLGVTTAALSNNAVTSAKILDGTITANDLSPAVVASTFWRLGGNAGTTAGTHFLGTTDDQPLEVKVNGARVFRLEPTTNGAPNVIGGASVNYVEPGIVGATIGGGGTVNAFGTGLAFSNRISIEYATIGGGYGNVVEGFGRFGVIGGGFSNVITSGNFASVIGGGYRNRLLSATIGGVRANVIAGGTENLMDGICNNSVIGGGEDNQMIAQCGDAVIGGGDGNRMRSAHSSVIAGGETNEIWHALNVTVGGGRGNSVITNSVFSAIAGGVRNSVRMNSPFSSIGGGSNNVAGAAFATIPGGQRNEAAGDFSFAAGRRARALHDGTFVWADQGSVSSGTEFSSTSSNQFLIRAARGVGIGTNNPQTALHVVGTVTATAFSPPSDRNLKENFTDVNPRDVLERVARIAITRWNFKGDTATPHFGPMAQDFHAAFGLGADDKHIATVDADGVALAAIQGLNQKLDAENEAMRLELRATDARLAELERRLTALERRGSRLSPGTESNHIP